MEQWMHSLSGRWYAFLAFLYGRLPGTDDFEKGFYLALILVGAILLLLLILKLIFRRPAVNEIVLARADGDVVISRNAVVSLVLGLEEAFPEMELLKVKLSRLSGKALKITVQVNSRAQQDAFPVQAEALKARIFSDLQQTFGVDSVTKVEIRLQKKIGAKLPPAPPATPGPAPFYGTGL